MNEYTIKSSKRWGQDNVYSLTFEEDNSEPIDYRDPVVEPRVGEKIAGKIEEYTTNSGSVRRMFITKDSLNKEEARQLEINTSWAIGLATQIAMDYEPATIKANAEMLLHIKKELLK